jgi:hypothetical protein
VGSFWIEHSHFAVHHLLENHRAKSNRVFLRRFAPEMTVFSEKVSPEDPKIDKIHKNRPKSSETKASELHFWSYGGFLKDGANHFVKFRNFDEIGVVLHRG